MNFTYLT